MTDCIYCGAVADSREDWLPRGLGKIRNITLLKDRICADCNNELGRAVDEDLLRTGPAGFFRSYLGIQGRHGASPNPFHYRAMGPVSPLKMTRPSPDGKHEILGEAYRDGNGHVRPLRQLVYQKPDDQIVCVPFPPAYDGARLRALLRERGVEDLEPFEVYLGPDETPDNVAFIRVLKDAIGTLNPLVWYGEGSSRKEDVTLEGGINLAYIRALAKIAFHYYLWTSPVHSGAELHFHPIRQFIRHGIGERSEFVRLTGDQFIGQLAQGQVPERFSHFIGAWRSGSLLVGAVQLFVGPEHMTPPSLVRLAQLSRPIDTRIHWVSYFGEQIDGFDGEIAEVPESQEP